MASVNMTVRVWVRVDPDGAKPSLWGRVRLAMWILFGRPVSFRSTIAKR